jgi:hypothetical protein
MADQTPGPAGSAAAPPRPRTSGWVKLGAGLAVIGAQVAEGVLHPEMAEALEISDVAIPLITGLIVFATVVWGSRETVDRVFRLLRWVANRPEPATPESPASSEPAVAAAEDPLARMTATIGPVSPASPDPSSGNDLSARHAATLHEFDVPPEQGLSREQASAAFKEHGLDPRSFGFWVRSGHLAREGNRRWLTDKGRDWVSFAMSVRTPAEGRQADGATPVAS